MAVTRAKIKGRRGTQSHRASISGGSVAVEADGHVAWEIIDRLLGSYVLRRPASVAILGLTDVVSLLVGLSIAGYFTTNAAVMAVETPYAPLLVLVWLTVLAAFRLYDRAFRRRDPLALVKAVVLYFGLLLASVAAYPEFGFGVGEVLVAALVTAFMVGGARFAYERATNSLYDKRLGQTRTLLVGDDESRGRVMDAPGPGAYKYVGELTTDRGGVDLRSLRHALDRTQARQVVVTGAEVLPENNFANLVRSCRLRRVGISVVPSTVASVGGRVSLSHDVGVPMLAVEYPTLDNYQRMLKRGLDFFGSLLGLIAISPLLLAVAAAIKLTSPGPVLFAQKRVGVDEKVFLCYKFRSMYRDAEQRQKELEALNEAEGAVFKIRNDPRITPVGGLIRRFSIDELPQLLNVLRGEMSLVGPRPLPVRDFELMSEEHRRRLGAMPGMTGYWQISGRSNLSFDEMVELDLYYIENWSLSFDVKIVARTLGAVLRHEGAY